LNPKLQDFGLVKNVFFSHHIAGNETHFHRVRKYFTSLSISKVFSFSLWLQGILQASDKFAGLTHMHHHAIKLVVGPKQC
jgi:hypothetical protein